MKSRIIFINTVFLFATSAFAQSGMAGMSDASDGIITYIPYVQALCYTIAAIIAVIGAVTVYIGMHTNPQQTSKRIMITAGSCLAFVCMAVSLPKFFGLDGSVTGSSSGSSSSGSSGSGDGFLSTDEGGISESGIDASIPPVKDNSGNWITFPEGTNMDIANQVMNIYDHMGSGANGSTRRTMEYIKEQYRTGNIDETTYDQMMTAANSLPRN